MAITDKKITSGEINKSHVQKQPDKLTGTAQENKSVFDTLPELIASKHNEALDEIVGAFSAQNAKVETINTALNERMDEIASSANPLVPLGMYSTIEELQEAHPTGSAGDAWLIGDYTSNVVYLWDVDHEQWMNAGALAQGNGFKSAYNRSFEDTASNIQMDGTASAGSSVKVARADHAHPSDTSKADLQNGYVVDEQLLEQETITKWNTILGIS